MNHRGQESVMPRKKVPCPACGQPKKAESRVCRACSQPYPRTAAHRKRLSAALAGKPKPWLRGRKRPKHSKTMKAWWTPERREAARQRMLELVGNPNSRYHGLSARGAKLLREALGCCERCGGDGTESRLDLHHRNGDKHDHRLANLAVLCHRCHMQNHSEQGDLKRS